MQILEGRKDEWGWTGGDGNFLPDERGERGEGGGGGE